MTDKFKDMNGVLLQGHIKITDPASGEVLIDKRNAIHYENMSIALAESLASAGQGPIYKMAFGNGGTSVDPTGIITYLTPNSTGSNASLYNQTFEKIVAVDPNNTDPVRNKIETRHVSGTNYTDILVSCLLDYGEPSGQDAFDTASDTESLYVFDELGLVSSAAGTGTGKLLTHVIFHPVQKSLNRLLQIDYTVRIQTLTNLSSI